MATKENTAGIKKVQKYKNITTAKIEISQERLSGLIREEKANINRNKDKKSM